MTQRILFALMIFSAIPVSAKLKHDSASLMMKNSEQVADLVNKKIKRAADLQAAQTDDESSDGIHVEPEAIMALKEGLEIALSRPDQDGTRNKLFTKLRRELSDLNSWDKTVESVADDAIASLKSESDSVKIQATQIVLLENLMAEIKPDVESNDVYRRIIEKIRDASLTIPKKVKERELMTSMNVPVSPSETAASILPKGSKKKK